MSKLTALSISIAVLGGIWAFLALGPLAGFVLVWAGFIAWACFFHTGADMPALQKTIVGMSYGAVIAGIALLLATTNPLALPGVIILHRKMGQILQKTAKETHFSHAEKWSEIRSRKHHVSNCIILVQYTDV